MIQITVKLQRDLTGTKILVTEAATGAFLYECIGEEAANARLIAAALTGSQP